MEDNKMKKDNIDIHSMLVQAYDSEGASKDVNVRLMNQLQYREQTKAHGVSFWWLPAVINTCIMGCICGISILAFYILKYVSMDWIMPNLIQAISKMALFFICGVAAIQVMISWMFTLLSVWKLNLRNKCHIFD